MNQYLFLRSIRAPILLLVFGITAVLHVYAGIGYWQSWPLYLIVLGLLQLAERLALSQQQPYPPPPGYPAGYRSTSAAEPVDAPTTAIVPVHRGEGRQR